MFQCLLDLDGVIVNFVKGALKAIDKEDFDFLDWPPGEWDFTNVFGISDAKMWSAIEAYPKFWEKLEWMPDGKAILDLVEAKFGKENICILTSPSLDPYAASGKMRWIKQHLPAYSRRFLIGSSKHFCTNSNRVLIDDSSANISKFIEHGGKTILVPRIWNDLHNIETLTYIEKQLELY